MKTDTSEKIIQFIKQNQQTNPAQLAEYFEFSSQAIHRQLKKLITQGRLRKIGKPPKVFYLINNQQTISENAAINLLSNTYKNRIQLRFLQITPEGRMLEGIEAFIYWCQKHKLPLQKTAEEYIKTLSKYDKYKNIDGYIDGTAKIKTSFDKIYLDQVYYLDFYSIERFGKTKLGQMLLYAKQGQDEKLIKKIILQIKPQIKKLIKIKKIDAVGFIPPTVKRSVQFMKKMEDILMLKINKISIEKPRTEIIIPQKSLSKIQDRIENAQKTIFITGSNIYNNILLIDDAVGSGATLNETAKKIRERKICTGKIFGLALTGSYKGFDIISEV